MEVDLTQTHDVLGTYHSIDFSDIRLIFQILERNIKMKVLDMLLKYLMKKSKLDI